ncbi:hypothetical protein PRZ48_004936 [Zasmidium cellare]|uniref:Protein kinase domain-containing protein n=1 Tax=Zasmidium cellare TaxID=395010 RepID=A0ABR0ESB1_ZASCE|nr:hypothetical protein PRZ48_004936 [Zasmidium cellare]
MLGALLSTFWAKKPQPNDSQVDSVVEQGSKRKGASWAPDSEQARFENESEQLILKELGSGAFATVFATIGKSDANNSVIEYNRAKGNPVQQKAVIENMRKSLLAAKLLDSRLIGMEQYADEFRLEISMLRYVAKAYLDKEKHGVARILHPDIGPKPRSWYQMEMLTGGALCDFRHLFWKRPPPLGGTIPAGLLWHMIAQLTETLMFLNFGIVDGKRIKNCHIIAHHDLHEGNILFRWPGTTHQFYPDVVVADFGRSFEMPLDMDDEEYADEIYRTQVRDLRQLIVALGILTSKAGEDGDTLEGVLALLDGVQVSSKNIDMKRVLNKAMLFARRRRLEFYNKLPEAWIQYFSRPAVSDKELEIFLQQFKRA